MLAEISFIYNLLGFLYQFFKNDDDKEEDFDTTEKWVAEQLMEFEFAELQKNPTDMKQKEIVIPRNTSCFHRSGIYSSSPIILSSIKRPSVYTQYACIHAELHLQSLRDKSG